MQPWWTHLCPDRPLKWEAAADWGDVDGAHGASAALSPRYRHLVKGIERADSVVWDAHKLLMMPALITAVLLREGHRSFESFAQESSYLFTGQDTRRWSDVALRTLECTKEMMALKLYTCLHTLGTRLFADGVTGTFDLARHFAGRLESSGDFELAVPPDCNIVCFRHTPKGVPAAELDALQVMPVRKGTGLRFVRRPLPEELMRRPPAKPDQDPDTAKE